MQKNKGLVLIALFSVLMSGCNNSKNVTETEPAAVVQNTETAESVTEVEETTVETQVENIVEERETDKIVCDWLYKSLTDSEEFTDINNYRYYARTLGLDKDYFLNPNMWEVYYNPAININKEMNGQ